MTSFYETLEDCLGNSEAITTLFTNFDIILRHLHNNGYWISNFDITKIEMNNNMPTFESLRKNGLLARENVTPQIKASNIYQLAKVFLMAYNGRIVDAYLNEEYFNFIKSNFDQSNANGLIPNDVYEYFGEIFLRLNFENIVYYQEYLDKKQENLNGNQNSRVNRKSLATDIGRAFAQEDAAYVNILFIPSILALVYLVGLLIYIFFIR